VRAIAGSPAGDRVATASDDGTARLWDAQGRLRAVLRPGKRLTAVAFSPDGRLVATGSEDRSASLWDEAGTEVAVFRGHAGTVNDVAFSPRGDRVITASDDGTARSWSLDGRLDDVFPHGAPVDGARTAADGRTVLTFSRGGEAALWLADVEALLPEAEVRILRDLTRAERAEHRDLLGPRNELALLAHDRVEALFRELVVGVAVREAVLADPTMAEGVRREALRLLSSHRDDVDRLNREAWSIARAPDHDPDEYERAVRVARAAVRLAPDDGDLLNTLGVAQYRAGDFESAVGTLERAVEARGRAGEGPAAEDLSFLAMAHGRAGRTSDARRHLSRLRLLLEGAEHRNDVGARDFLEEAESVVSGAAPRGR
jgi:hypothetical protein